MMIWHISGKELDSEARPYLFQDATGSALLVSLSAAAAALARAAAAKLEWPLTGTSPGPGGAFLSASQPWVTGTVITHLISYNSDHDIILIYSYIVRCRRTFFLTRIRWHDALAPHSFVVCRPAVCQGRSRLQAAKSWTDIRNNRYNTRNLASLYHDNSLGSAEIC